MSARPPLAGALLLAALAAAPRLAAAQSFTTSKADIGGAGGNDYLTADPATGRVFVSRATHVMVVDGATGKVVGDVPDTPRVHGVAFAPKWNRGFTTNAGDSTVTMFDATTLAVVRKIHAGIDGLDGITYDEATDRIVTLDHSHPRGTAVVLDAHTGDVVGTVPLSGQAPEGGVGDGTGRLFVNVEDRDAVDVVDLRALKVVATWPIAPCEGPTGIAYDRASRRLFSGCDGTSVAVDAATGKVVARIPSGAGVDALAWDAAERLLYVPAGRDGTMNVVRQDAPDRYTVVATVRTVPGARTMALDPTRHVAYTFAPEFGPAPAGAPPGPGGRPARGPVVAAWFVTVRH